MAPISTLSSTNVLDICCMHSSYAAQRAAGAEYYKWKMIVATQLAHTITIDSPTAEEPPELDTYL